MVRQAIGLVFVGATLMATGSAYPGAVAPQQPASAPPLSHQTLLDQYCLTCHNDSVVNDSGESRSAMELQLQTAGIALDTMDLGNIAADAAKWERVVRKVRAGVMPPAGLPRPDETAQDQFIGWLEDELDLAAAGAPDPGRTASLHRLNRAEYRNAIRDLLALDLEVVDFLPADDSSYGFDNIGDVLRISQSLLERYLSVATTISRMALGGTHRRRNRRPTGMRRTFSNTTEWTGCRLVRVAGSPSRTSFPKMPPTRSISD